MNIAYRPDNPLRVGIFWSLSTAATSLNALTRNLWHVAESFRQVAEPWPAHSDPKVRILSGNCLGKKSFKIKSIAYLGHFKYQQSITVRW